LSCLGIDDLAKRTQSLHQLMKQRTLILSFKVSAIKLANRLFSGSQNRIFVDQLINQSHFIGFARINIFAGKQVGQSILDANESGQPLGSSTARQQSKL